MKHLILVLLFMPILVWSQEFRKCPSFNSEENWEDQKVFFESEKVVINLLEWLTSVPPTEQLIERSAASIYVMEWVSKHPVLKVNVEVGPYEEFLISEDLTLSYLFGNILFVLKHEGKIKTEAQRIAGLKSLLFLVERSESYSKNKIFKSLLRANRKGELNEFDKEMWLNHTSKFLLGSEIMN